MPAITVDHTSPVISLPFHPVITDPPVPNGGVNVEVRAFKDGEVGYLYNALVIESSEERLETINPIVVGLATGESDPEKAMGCMEDFIVNGKVGVVFLMRKDKAEEYVKNAERREPTTEQFKQAVNQYPKEVYK